MLASALLPTVAAQATTYYVDPSGSDSNSGTEKTPFATVKKCLGLLLGGGDTCLIKNGTYMQTGALRIAFGGTATAPVQLKAYPGHAPVIQFPVNTNDLLTQYELTVREGGGYGVPMGYVVIEGLTFRYGYNGIHAYACNHCTFRRNYFDDQFGSGILIVSSIDTTIDSNVIRDAGSFRPNGSGRAHGIYVAGSRLIITNNIIYNSATFGIQLNGIMAFDPKKFPTQEYSDTKDAIIANNVLAYSIKGSGLVIWGSRVTNARILNNIFYENWSTGPSSYPNGINWVACCSEGVQVNNNIFYATGSGATMMSYGSAVEGVHYTQSGNSINASAPDFVNAPATLPASPNFKLNERSPAIDKGLPLTATRVDFDGTTRPQGRAYDIGAYEYRAGNDTQSPAAPMLQIH